MAGLIATKKGKEKVGYVILPRMWVTKEEEWMKTVSFCLLALLLLLYTRYSYNTDSHPWTPQLQKVYKYLSWYTEGCGKKKAAFQSNLCICATDKQKREKNGERQENAFLRHCLLARGGKNIVWTGSLVTASCQADVSSSLILFTSDVFPADIPAAL